DLAARPSETTDAGAPNTLGKDRLSAWTLVRAEQESNNTLADSWRRAGGKKRDAPAARSHDGWSSRLIPAPTWNCYQRSEIIAEKCHGTCAENRLDGYVKRADISIEPFNSGRYWKSPGPVRR